MAASAHSTAPQSNPFVKQLVSSNRTTRDRALLSLRSYLHRTAPFGATDFLKIWKALFYSMFMSDKPRNQQQLARDLASLVDVCRTRENKIGFLRAFWITMGREWSGIDSLRMDKFLYLVRCLAGKGFEVCKGNGSEAWREMEVWEEYQEVLCEEGGPLSPRDVKVPIGLKLHVVDVWVDELEKVDEVRNAPMQEIMMPVKRLGKESLAKNVRAKVQECLEDGRLKNWSGDGVVESGDEDDDEDEQDFAGFDD